MIRMNVIKEVMLMDHDEEKNKLNYNELNDQEKIENNVETDVETEQDAKLAKSDSTEVNNDKEERTPKSRTSQRVKSNLLTAILVGIISSLLTLSLVLYTPLFQGKMGNTQTDNEQTEVADRDLSQTEQVTEGVSTKSSLVNMI